MYVFVFGDAFVRSVALLMAVFETLIIAEDRMKSWHFAGLALEIL